MNNLIFSVENEVWKTNWNDTVLEVIPTKFNYIVKQDSNIIFENIILMDLLYKLTNLTKMNPLFKSSRKESVRLKT